MLCREFTSDNIQGKLSVCLYVCLCVPLQRVSESTECANPVTALAEVLDLLKFPFYDKTSSRT